MVIKVTDIQWDVDDDDDADLPSEFIIKSDSDDADIISDLISDAYGFCHKGFNYKVIGE